MFTVLPILITKRINNAAKKLPNIGLIISLIGLLKPIQKTAVSNVLTNKLIWVSDTFFTTLFPNNIRAIYGRTITMILEKE
jgi:50S ribosomal subunit-associated GTPase HflX